MQKEFEVISGVLVCSDPCYIHPDLGGVWCQGIVDNVKNGTWIAEVIETDEGDWGKRIALLGIKHKDVDEPDANVDIMNFAGGVDSGQFGFFDKDFYRNDELTKDLDKENFGENYDTQEGDTWYRACSKLTLGNDQWGVLPNGVVSSSGFGDGSYDVYGAKDGSGEYVYFSVIFIHEEDEEDFEEEEEEIEE
jgi:hypothetical protein